MTAKSMEANMNGPVGWHFDNETSLIRPVAEICQTGELMSVRFFARIIGGRIGMGKPETIAQKDFFGAPVFVFCRITGANCWWLDERGLRIRPVAEVLDARRSNENIRVRFVAGRGGKSDPVSLAAHEVLHDIHSNAFQRLTRLLRGDE